MDSFEKADAEHCESLEAYGELHIVRKKDLLKATQECKELQIVKSKVLEK